MAVAEDPEVVVNCVANHQLPPKEVQDLPTGEPGRLWLLGPTVLIIVSPEEFSVWCVRKRK